MWFTGCDVPEFISQQALLYIIYVFYRLLKNPTPRDLVIHEVAWSDGKSVDFKVKGVQPTLVATLTTGPPGRPFNCAASNSLMKLRQLCLA